MSDFINHYHCGEEALKLVDASINEAISKNRILFNFGCQGPDFFLYHGVVPWHRNFGYAKFGEIIHASETNLLFSAMIEYYQKTENIDTKEKVLSYIMGYACHHSLDSITHPFIFFYSGFASHLHKEYEMILDVLNCKHQGYSDAVTFDLEKIIPVSDKDIQMIQNFHAYIIWRVSGETLPEAAVKTCVGDYSQLLSLFPDPMGIKRKLAKTVERIIKKPHAISKAFIQKNIKDIDDYMNLTHSRWLHPCDKDIVSDTSYPDLFDRAIDDAALKVAGLFQISGLDDIDHEIAKIIKNFSFETGEVFYYENNKNTIKMKYYSPKDF
ncbi:MAG: zinc dependent phospholipase C family protein [Eubacteriales bacterium]|nr:zinc dependent phospholipase C family protein [Eubacteriales bacterium]